MRRLCYFDGEPCSCDAFDVAGECPRDTLYHDDDQDDMFDDELVTEEMIDNGYETKSQRQGNDEDFTDRF